MWQKNRHVDYMGLVAVLSGGYKSVPHFNRTTVSDVVAQAGIILQPQELQMPQPTGKYLEVNRKLSSPAFRPG